MENMKQYLERDMKHDLYFLARLINLQRQEGKKTKRQEVASLSFFLLDLFLHPLFHLFIHLFTNLFIYLFFIIVIQSWRS